MKKILTVIMAIFLVMPLSAKKDDPKFIIAGAGKAAPIVVGEDDWKGVRRAAADLADDIGKVTGTKSAVHSEMAGANGQIIAGTIGKSSLIDRLIASGKLNVDSVRGEWESYVTEVIDGNLVIAGSDKRGTIYGIYDISRKIGVSPWYYWADVPVRHQDRLANYMTKIGKYRT